MIAASRLSTHSTNSKCRNRNSHRTMIHEEKNACLQRSRKNIHRPRTRNRRKRKAVASLQPLIKMEKPHIPDPLLRNKLPSNTRETVLPKIPKKLQSTRNTKRKRCYQTTQRNK